MAEPEDSNAGSPGVRVESLPHRQRATADPARARPARLHKVELPSPSVLLIARRLLRLVAGLSTWSVLASWDALLRRRDPWQRSRRVEQVLRRMGGNAIRLGEELGQRIDLIPFELYFTLVQAPDPAPPLPVQAAIDALQQVSGRPAGEFLEQIDPQPIESDSMVCAWQAVLRDGRKVVVRVQRHGIREVYAADVTALVLLLRLLELFTIVRPGMVSRLSEELRSMVAEDLDLSTASRFHRLFRRYGRKAGLPWFSAARVVHTLTGPDVLVTEFVSGIWLDEVLLAVQTGDAQAVARMTELGINPRKVAQRVLHGAWWSFFECPFFQGAPDPRTVVVEPGNRLVFTRLRDCGGLASRKRQLFAEVLDRMARRDVSSAAETVVQILAPLPYIDVHDFTKAIEARLWQQLFVIEDRCGATADRTSMGVWLAVLEVSLAYDVPIRGEIVRAMRGLILFDSVAERLNPRLHFFDELRRYQARADRRAARTLRREVEGTSVGDLNAQVLARVRDGAQLLDRLRFFMVALTERVPVQFFSLTGKAAYAMAMSLNVGLVGGAFALSVWLGLRLYTAATGHELAYGSVVDFFIAHPIPSNIALALVLAVLIRRVLFRMNDREQE